MEDEFSSHSRPVPPNLMAQQQQQQEFAAAVQNALEHQAPMTSSFYNLEQPQFGGGVTIYDKFLQSKEQTTVSLKRKKEDQEAAKAAMIREGRHFKKHGDRGYFVIEDKRVKPGFTLEMIQHGYAAFQAGKQRAIPLEEPKEFIDFLEQRRNAKCKSKKVFRHSQNPPPAAFFE